MLSVLTTDQTGRNGRISKKSVALTIVLTTLILVAILVGVGYYYGLTTTPVGGTAAVSAEATRCSVQNASCEVVLTNTGTTNMQAVGCSFGGDNISIGLSGGDLSYKTGGPTITITVPSGSSVTVYCNGTRASPSSLETGSPVTGSVQLAKGGPAFFSANWQ